MAYLYKFESWESFHKNKNDCDIDIKEFKPSIQGVSLPGEKFGLKKFCVRILFQIMTRGGAKLFYVADKDGNLMHTSYVVPKCAKFPFLGRNDYEIGPCYTYPAYRGKGIYPKVLHYICNHMRNEKAVFYMIVDEANKSSIRGIEKAGFVKYGTVQKNKYTKRYYRTMQE